MHNPSSCTSRCPSAFLSVSLVPTLCTPPSPARPLQSSSVHPRVPHGSAGVLCLLGGAVFVLVPTGQLPWLGGRGAGLAVCRVVPCLAAPVMCASVPQCGCRRLGWPGLVAVLWAPCRRRCHNRSVIGCPGVRRPSTLCPGIEHACGLCALTLRPRVRCHGDPRAGVLMYDFLGGHACRRFSRLMCPGVRASRTARRTGLGVTFPCSPAGAGGLLGSVR